MWRKGLRVEQKHITPVSVVRVKKRTSDFWIKIVLAEGLKREIRLMARALGYSVRSLKRVGIGLMQLHSLARGEVIRVTEKQLMQMIIKGGKV
jgi:23S rRNA pseudouridine2605 synthase